MSFKVEELGKSMVKLTIEVAADEFEKAMETAYQKNKNKLSVQGFRKGKAPRAMIEKMYGAGIFYEDAANELIPDAYEKAQYAADILMKKMKRKGLKAEEIRSDYIGLNSLHLGVAEVDPEKLKDLNEVVLRIAIRTLTKDEAYKIVPEVSPLQLNGPPGASFFGGRAKVQEVIGLWPTLIPRDAVNLKSHILEIK